MPRRYNRKAMNQQLFNILEKNGLTVPEGVTLRCTIDPASCYIKISDNTGDNQDRRGLYEKMEEILNKGENGKSLYTHIIQSSYISKELESSQYVYEGRIKFEYYHNINGLSYGMKGDHNANFLRYCKKYYSAYAEKAAKVGFDGFLDMELSIDITSNGFKDAFQNVNWSDDEDPYIVGLISGTTYSTI